MSPAPQPWDAGPAGDVEVLRSATRRAIFEQLTNATGTARTSGLSAADLGELLRLHPTTVRFHLDQLQRHGLVEAAFERGQVGRPRKLYRLPARAAVPRVEDAEGAAAHTLLELLGELWGPGAPDERPLTPEAAGRRWALQHATGPGPEEAVPAATPGAFLGRIGAMLDVLAGWGYTPELRTRDGGRTAELNLHDCPLLSLARTQADVVCGVHRGLIRGAMEVQGETDVEVGLQPLVEPRRCLATVRARPGRFD